MARKGVPEPGLRAQQLGPGLAAQLVVGTPRRLQRLLAFFIQAGIVQSHRQLIGHGLQDGNGGPLECVRAIALRTEGSQYLPPYDKGQSRF